VRRAGRRFRWAEWPLSFSICLVFLSSEQVFSQGRQETPVNREFHWDWHNSQWLTAAKDSLRDAAMSEADRKAIAEAIAVQLRPGMEAMESPIKSEADLKKAALDTRVKSIDLSGDGVPDVVAQSVVDCGATGNCSLWIFKKNSASYGLLLKGFGQTFTIQLTKTNGYFDVVIGSHSSAKEQGLLEYRYRNGRYRQTACYVAGWEILEGENVRRLKEPRIEAYPCYR
jgi:hypothetical protein